MLHPSLSEFPSCQRWMNNRMHIKDVHRVSALWKAVGHGLILFREDRLLGFGTYNKLWLGDCSSQRNRGHTDAAVCVPAGASISSQTEA